MSSPDQGIETLYVLGLSVEFEATNTLHFSHLSEYTGIDILEEITVNQGKFTFRNLLIILFSLLKSFFREKMYANFYISYFLYPITFLEVCSMQIFT